MDCIFCKIVAGEIPSHNIYEDDATIAFMDINPATRGHALIVTREHAPDLFELSPEAAQAAARAVQLVARNVQQVLQPDGVNIVQNNGAAAGQVVMHYHVHVIPRWQGDQALRFWRPGETDHAALGDLAAQLRAAGGT